MQTVDSLTTWIHSPQEWHGRAEHENASCHYRHTHAGSRRSAISHERPSHARATLLANPIAPSRASPPILRRALACSLRRSALLARVSYTRTIRTQGYVSRATRSTDERNT